MSHSIRQLLACLDACESPIERQMFAAILCCRETAKVDDQIVWQTQHPETVGDQNIRIDIAASIPVLGILVAVELDGHDFHERTKEQARRDRSRDRALTAKGWTVLRFTGSEVHANALRCADQVFEVMRRLVKAAGAKAS